MDASETAMVMTTAALMDIRGLVLAHPNPEKVWAVTDLVYAQMRTQSQMLNHPGAAEFCRQLVDQVFEEVPPPTA